MLLLFGHDKCHANNRLVNSKRYHIMKLLTKTTTPTALELKSASESIPSWKKNKSTDREIHFLKFDLIKNIENGLLLHKKKSFVNHRRAIVTEV